MDNMRNCTKCSEGSGTQRNVSRETCTQENCSSDNCKHWAIGMAYVPWQKMGELNEPAQALRSGTLFPELDKPFYGSMRRGNRR